MINQAPSLEEIKEVKAFADNSAFKELNASGFFNDKRKVVMSYPMTEKIMKNAEKETKEELWKFCNKIAAYLHIPSKLEELCRMKKYAENPKITDAVLAALQEEIYPFPTDRLVLLPIVGYYYCIAFISQSEYRRDECLAHLEKLCDFFLSELPDKAWLLKRNMEVLKADYPDLEPLYNKLHAEKAL